jgi:Rrf2 family protein
MRNSPSIDQPILSRTAEYALRALLVLARHGTSRPLTADAIAEMTGTPANYLGKTLYALMKAGILRSTRGPSGGFALAADPATLTISQIVDVFSEPLGAPRCLLGTGLCDSSRPCDAHFQWKRVTNAAREPLRTTTVADLLGIRNGAPVASQSTPSMTGAAGTR